MLILRFFFCILILFFSVACERSTLEWVSSGGNQGSEIPADGNQGESEDVVVPSQILLHAQKSYNPSRWRDGSYVIKNEIGNLEFLKVSLPTEIPVTSGNAGNHRVTLFIDFQGGSLECYYKGGADINKPLQSGNSSQIEKGKKYLFEECSDGSEPGDLIKAQKNFLLTINNGDSSKTTSIRMPIQVDSYN